MDPELGGGGKGGLVGIWGRGKDQQLHFHGEGTSVRPHHLDGVLAGAPPASLSCCVPGLRDKAQRPLHSGFIEVFFFYCCFPFPLSELPLSESTSGR